MKVKIYEKRSEKVIDFLIGFILIPVIFAVTLAFLTRIRVIATNSYVYFIISIAEIAGVFYFGSKRKYIAMGFGYILVTFPLVGLGTCFLIANGFRWG